ncbi:MAG: hypothetical protein CL957_08230 [Euryarchaeota archaeon]|nr:hypothetical protein [Euryarchaeota archaeon]
MIALIVLRIPALGFCPCEQDLTLNNGFCCHEDSTLVDSDCCSSAPLETVNLCKDCLIVLSLDAGDFNWSGSQAQLPILKEAPSALPAGIQSNFQPWQSPRFLHGFSRGSEPPGRLMVLRQTGILRL